MASSLTYKGEEYMLNGDGSSDGGMARLAVKVKLYANGSAPAKDGSGMVEVVNGNGYVTGGNALIATNFTYASAPSRITLDDQTWTASGGSIANIAGAYITDASDNVLAWFERSSLLTLDDGDSITLDDLTIRLP